MSGEPDVRRDRPKLLLRVAVVLGAPPAVLTARPRPRRPFWGPVLRRALLHFVPIATAVTVGFGVSYLAVLEMAQRSAFSPQADSAAQAADRLNAGAPPQAVVPHYAIDVGTSRYPYLLVYDDTGQLLASSARLDGQHLALPAAVFDYVRTGQEHHDATWYAVYAGPAPWIVWMPRSDLSSAVVIERWSGGFVVAGRSMDGPAVEFALAWAVTLVFTALACLGIGVARPMEARPPPPGNGGDGGPDRDPPAPRRPRTRRFHGFRPIVRRRRRSRPRTRTPGS